MKVGSSSVQNAVLHNQSRVNKNLENSIKKLSTGERINSAKDDSSGLAISTRFTSTINGNKQAIQNIEDAISMIKVTEGASQSVIDQLIRLRNLSVRAQNDTFSMTDKESMKQEADEILNSIQGITNSTTYNNKKVLAAVSGINFKDEPSRYVTIPNQSSLLASDEFTVEVDLKMRETTEDQKLASLSIPYSGGFVLGVINGRLYPEVWDSSGNRYTFRNGTVPIDQDTTLGITWKTGGDLIGYIDGNETFRISASSDQVGNTTHDFMIGKAWSNGYYTPPDSTFNEVRYYKRELSSSEMKSNADGEVVRNGITGQWNFEGEDLVEDKSGNGYHGTAYNAEWAGDKKIDIHTGANSKDSSSISLNNLTLSNLGLKNFNVTDEQSIAVVDLAIEETTKQIQQNGNDIKRLEMKSNFLSTINTQNETTRMRIKDVNISEETSALVKNKILKQVSFSMLLESKSSQKSYLELLAN